MPILADLIIIAALVFTTITGTRRGLLQSLAGVVIVVVAFFGASWAADQLAEPVAEHLGPLIQERVREEIRDTLTGQQDAADVGELLQSLRFDGADLEKLVRDVLDRVVNTGQSITDAVSQSVAHSIAHTVVFIVAFLVLLLGLWLLSLPLRLVTRLPGLHALNALGGGALGLVWGALLLFVAVWAMQRFGWLITDELIEQTWLLKFFARNTPLGLLASM